MEHSPVYNPVVHHHSDASRPSLGFPLGTALLLLVIFSLSGIFSCCYHWDKFRSLRQSYSDDLDLEAANHPAKPNYPNYLLKQQQMESLPVIMPGDNIAKFIALPCPCEPHRPEMQAPIPTPNKPAKPPRFPVPLY
ncbi:hypothetical protein SOVF_013680 [Spinacia oleracea]|uniref:Uncharacterized protein At5g65660 n=1 Tax=Spinacia oleracea TaxID=3562 RepID=A0A9R0JEM7_SPIOL|nr:uncharacterized protein At5g65660 [Spinacia oleracea]KNA24651.1 hypothetical protein SOVF_013680 [Spinacia oleracea]